MERKLCEYMEILSISRLACVKYLQVSLHSFISAFKYFQKGALKNMVITRIYDNFFYMYVIWEKTLLLLL
jgi:hypothetical protein